MKDPIVEEVRKARDGFAKQFNYDLDAICDDLQKKQSEKGKMVVSFPPKKPVTQSQTDSEDGRPRPSLFDHAATGDDFLHRAPSIKHPAS